MEIESLLGLSVQTQAVLASGYASYLIVSRGLRKENSTADVIFATLILGIPTLGALAFASNAGLPLWQGVPIGFGAAIVTAALWRKWMRIWLDWILKKIGVSISTDHSNGCDLPLRFSSTGI